jgi:hypothetical protein
VDAVRAQSSNHQCRMTSDCICKCCYSAQGRDCRATQVKNLSERSVAQSVPQRTRLRIFRVFVNTKRKPVKRINHLALWRSMACLSV